MPSASVAGCCRARPGRTGPGRAEFDVNEWTSHLGISILSSFDGEIESSFLRARALSLVAVPSPSNELRPSCFCGSSARAQDIARAIERNENVE